SAAPQGKLSAANRAQRDCGSRRGIHANRPPKLAGLLKPKGIIEVPTPGVSQEIEQMNGAAGVDHHLRLDSVFGDSRKDGKLRRGGKVENEGEEANDCAKALSPA